MWPPGRRTACSSTTLASPATAAMYRRAVNRKWCAVGVRSVRVVERRSRVLYLPERVSVAAAHAEPGAPGTHLPGVRPERRSAGAIGGRGQRTRAAEVVVAATAAVPAVCVVAGGVDAAERSGNVRWSGDNGDAGASGSLHSHQAGAVSAGASSGRLGAHRRKERRQHHGRHSGAVAGDARSRGAVAASDGHRFDGATGARRLGYRARVVARQRRAHRAARSAHNMKASDAPLVARSPLSYTFPFTRASRRVRWRAAPGAPGRQRAPVGNALRQLQLTYRRQ
eukprot:ctg_266.g120